MNTDTINGRLAAALDNQRLTIRQVHAATGIPYDTLQQALSNKIKAMGIDKFALIWQTYPQLDGWHILTGLPSANPCADAEDKLQQVRAIVL